MNVRNVLVVSLLFVPCNHKREEVALERQELAWKALVSRGGSNRFQVSSIHKSKQGSELLMKFISTIESRSSRTRSSSSLNAEKSVAFLVPNLGMSLTLHGLTLLSP